MISISSHAAALTTTLRRRTFQEALEVGIAVGTVSILYSRVACKGRKEELPADESWDACADCETAAAGREAASKGINAALKAISKYRLTAADLTEVLRLVAVAEVVVAVHWRADLSSRDSAGNTWTGRGRPPLWLGAAEKAGKTRESFLIGAKRSESQPGQGQDEESEPEA